MNRFDTESRISLCNRQPYGFTKVTSEESTVMSMSCCKSQLENQGSSWAPMKVTEEAANQLTVAVTASISHNKNSPAIKPQCRLAQKRKSGGIHHRTETLPDCHCLSSSSSNARPNSVMSCVLAPR